MTDETRKAILRNAKRMSYALLAERYGVTRNQVAGIVWRSKVPPYSRVCSPNGIAANKAGTGHHGPGALPRIRYKPGRRSTPRPIIVRGSGDQS